MEQYNLKFVAPNKYPSECLITIYRPSGIVIAIDIDKGMSVTNACAEIANEVVRQYDVNPQRMISSSNIDPAEWIRRRIWYSLTLQMARLLEILSGPTYQLTTSKR